VDTVPTARWRDLQAAMCEQQILVIGTRLPLLRGGRRFWGHSVLRPLGFRVEPALPESALREALTVSSDEMLIFHQDGAAEIVPASALRPLTRVGLRQTAGEVSA